MERRAVTRDVIEREAKRSTKASAAIEGRTVPAGFQRSAKVQRFLDERQPRVR
jgi:hypothetical protein